MHAAGRFRAAFKFLETTGATPRALANKRSMSYGTGTTKPPGLAAGEANGGDATGVAPGYAASMTASGQDSSSFSVDCGLEAGLAFFVGVIMSTSGKSAQSESESCIFVVSKQGEVRGKG